MSRWGLFFAILMFMLLSVGLFVGGYFFAYWSQKLQPVPPCKQSSLIASANLTADSETAPAPTYATNPWTGQPTAEALAAAEAAGTTPGASTAAKPGTPAKGAPSMMDKQLSLLQAAGVSKLATVAPRELQANIKAFAPPKQTASKSAPPAPAAAPTAPAPAATVEPPAPPEPAPSAAPPAS